MTDTTLLILLRHGETAWNRDRRIQGQLDTPLADEGRRQARAAARRLAAERGRWGLPEPGAQAGAVLYSSDLARCLETAAPIAAALDLDCTPEPGLRERAFGAFEGRTIDELSRADPQAWSRWRARDPDFDAGGGESLRRLAARIEAVLAGLVERHAGGTLVLVTHGGVLDVVNRLARGTPLEAPRDFEIPNAALNRLRRTGGRLEILDWADASHWRDAPDDAATA